MKWWAGIALGAIALTVYGLSKLARAGYNLVTEIKGRIHKVDLSGITFSIDAILKNPTQTAINIQYPFIKIFYKDKLIATSDLKNLPVRIAPLSQTMIKDIRIPVSYLKLTGLATEFVRKMQNRKLPVVINVAVQTSINTGVNSIPFSSSETITF